MSEAPEFLIFMGRFHPLVVHLPIGFLILAFLMTTAAKWKRFNNLKPAIPFVLLAGVASAVVAVILGFMLSLEGGYNDITLAWHKWMGIGVVGLSILVYAVHVNWLGLKENKNRSFYIQGLMVVCLGITGHMGGNLTHGSEYLVQYAPQPLKKLAGVSGSDDHNLPPVQVLDSAFVYGHVVAPMLDSRCKTCHNPDKKKGELVLTSAKAIMEGGENGAVIMPGDKSDSELYRRITLDPEHEEFMPTEGKTPLTKEQVMIIGWWIDQGAPFEGQLATMDITDEVRPLLEKALNVGSGAPDLVTRLNQNVPPASPETIQKLRKHGFHVNQLAQDGGLLDVTFMPGINNQLDKEDLEMLLEAREQITWLNLSGTTITNDDLEIVAQLPNLTRLRLDKTDVGNAGVTQLKALENLEYLNLFGTNVDNEVLEIVASLPNLKRLFAAQTKVTDEAKEKVRQTNDQLIVNLGVEI